MKGSFPVPETVIAVGVRQELRSKEECEATHRGERSTFLAGPSGDRSWEQDWHDRSEFERQEGAQMGHSTYERGTVFARRLPVREDDPPI